MAAASSSLWEYYISNSLSQIRDAKLERVLRPLVPDGSSAVQVWTVQLQQTVCDISASSFVSACVNLSISA
jgi:hypothetical protein